MSNYRNKKLLEAVREFPCAMCGRQDGTVCAAHSNQQRDCKGTGIKCQGNSSCKPGWKYCKQKYIYYASNSTK